MQTFKIYTLGCKVNQYESQGIRETLSKNNLVESINNKADVCVINTCTVTGEADKKSLYFIKRAFRENPKAKIIATGCLVENDKDKVLAINKNILIVKNKDKNIGISDFKGHDRAFLKIQDGCQNYCSYCKVPFVRPKLVSRPLEAVQEEAKRLAGKGFKEIVLTGICLGAYGQDLSPKLELADSLESLEKIKGMPRIRLSSIEAKDINKRLIRKIKDSPLVCKHLHLPLQSGDDEILKKMNRLFSIKNFLKLTDNLKKKIPQISITTDIIVGFPGEGEDNFKNTIEALNKFKPLRTHIFSYSDRPGTKAFNFYPKVRSQIIKRRFLELKELADELSFEYRKKFLNKKVEVLVEQDLDRASGLQTGYSDNYIKVLINSKENLKGQLVNVKIARVTKENTYVG